MAKQIPVTNRASQIEYAIRDVVVPATALEADGHNIIKLNIGDPLAYPGLPTPKHMIEAYQKAIVNQKNGYSPAYGIEELRSAIAVNEQTKINGGWNCKSNDVYVCHGVTEALQIIFAAYLNEGDEVLIPSPYWVSYPEIVKLSDAIPVFIETNSETDFKVTGKMLEDNITQKTKMILLNSPSNPSGFIYSEDDLKKSAEIYFSALYFCF